MGQSIKLGRVMLSQMHPRVLQCAILQRLLLSPHHYVGAGLDNGCIKQQGSEGKGKQGEDWPRVERRKL